jgi:hypothetical protein
MRKTKKELHKARTPIERIFYDVFKREMTTEERRVLGGWHTLSRIFLLTKGRVGQALSGLELAGAASLRSLQGCDSYN